MRRKESRFLSELRLTFINEYNCFWYKIPDLPVYAGMKTRFNVSKPFDAVLLAQGKPIAIEAKYLADYGSFGPKNLTASQVEGLCDWQAAGGEAYVFLNIRRKQDKERNLTRLNRLLIFDWTALRVRTSNYSKQEMLSFPFVEGFKGQFDFDKLKREIFKDEENGHGKTAGSETNNFQLS
jgi:hypothetical protein